MMKNPWYSTILLNSLLLVMAQATPIVWDGESADNNISTGLNWVGDVAPVSGVDGMDINDTGGQPVINVPFTLASGQSIITTQAAGNAVLRISASGMLTIQSGAILDMATGPATGILAESGNGGRFVLHAGATASLDRYFDAIDFTTTFIANATGVTTLNAGTIFLRDQNILNIDLTNYDINNGTSLTLIDYGSNSIGGTTDGDFDLVQIIGGFSGSLNYTGGDGTAIVLENIAAIPEPSAFSFLGFGAGLVFLFRRRIPGVFGHEPAPEAAEPHR